jgi:hypothetical protein
VQLSLNFLTPPQPATPLERLEPEQRAELVLALARIITKAAGHPEPPMIEEAVTTTPTQETRHD